MARARAWIDVPAGRCDACAERAGGCTECLLASALIESRRQVEALQNDWRKAWADPASIAATERARVVEAIAKHFADESDMLNHRRVVQQNSLVCERREWAFRDAACIVRSHNWAPPEEESP